VLFEIDARPTARPRSALYRSVHRLAKSMSRYRVLPERQPAGDYFALT